MQDTLEEALAVRLGRRAGMLSITIIKKGEPGQPHAPGHLIPYLGHIPPHRTRSVTIGIA